MKKIGIYFFCVVALGCVTSSILYRNKKNEMGLEKSASEKSVSEEAAEFSDMPEQMNDSEQQKETVEVSDIYVSDKRFLVKEEDGYLVIYDRASMKRYDETTIQMHDLPEFLQRQTEEGLYFSDEEELYSFLENYSS